jgi:RNA polymerase sigma-70 factor, ECF subfamily
VDEDRELLGRLRARDEGAFVALVERYHPAMIRLASTFVPSQAVAEEVVQETWLAVLRGIDRFEGRSTFRTWLFRILVNRARTTGVRERRSVPVAVDDHAVDPRRFASDGQWSTPPVPWPDDVDDRLEAAATAKRVRAAIAALPDAQRQVVTLRDGEGLSASEVCAILELTEGNQRVLLHRGRSAVRRAIDAELVAG